MGYLSSYFYFFQPRIIILVPSNMLSNLKVGCLHISQSTKQIVLRMWQKDDWISKWYKDKVSYYMAHIT